MAWSNSPPLIDYRCNLGSAEHGVGIVHGLAGWAPPPAYAVQRQGQKVITVQPNSNRLDDDIRCCVRPYSTRDHESVVLKIHLKA